MTTEGVSSSSKVDDGMHKKFIMILPVLFYEYLSISIAKSLIPQLLLNEFKQSTYIVLGLMETVKGLLAFFSCPLFGRISDHVGRKYCLLVSVIGTSLPICVLAYTNNIYVFVVTTALSGAFSVTFPLTFAYIADCVEKTKRAPAYGLALATFGLSFCVGPVVGSYVALKFGDRSVFIISVLLLLGNVIYIILWLPETNKTSSQAKSPLQSFKAIRTVAFDYLPSSWNIAVTFRIFNQEPFMRILGVVVLLYYTAVWALVSTLVVHVTRYLNFSKVQLGFFMSAYGFATMISEAVLVRFIVPVVGEVVSIQIGLIAFAIQCIIVAFASSTTAIAASILLSMLANLVYPSISSLLSRLVSEDGQGEALGALNGIKALTEGFGPLIFGTLMSLFETSPIPGAPYLLGCFFSLFACLHCFELPFDSESSIYGYNYIRLSQFKQSSLSPTTTITTSNNSNNNNINSLKPFSRDNNDQFESNSLLRKREINNSNGSDHMNQDDEYDEND